MVDKKIRRHLFVSLVGAINSPTLHPDGHQIVSMIALSCPDKKIRMARVVRTFVFHFWHRREENEAVRPPLALFGHGGMSDQSPLCAPKRTFSNHSKFLGSRSHAWPTEQRPERAVKTAQRADDLPVVPICRGRRWPGSSGNGRRCSQRCIPIARRRPRLTHQAGFCLACVH